MFKECNRIEKINNSVLLSKEKKVYQPKFIKKIGANGEMSDFQEVTRKLKEVDKKAKMFDDNINHTPKDLANYLG